MAETQNTVKKQIYVSKQNLQTVLEFLKTQNEKLYLAKHATADEAAKVSKSLKITVGDNPQIVFNGEVEHTIEVAAKTHKHKSTDINDFSGAVKKIVFGDENNQGTVTAHSHDNLTALNMVSEQYIKDWNAKIGVDDVARLKYNNAGVGGQTDVKTALDILIKNIQISNAALTDTTANVNGLATRLNQAESDIDQAQTDITALKTAVGDASSGLVKDVADLKTSVAEGGTISDAIADAKKAGTDAQTAVQNEVTRAQGVEAGLQSSIDAINNTSTGILAKAKAYTDEREEVLDGKIATAQAKAEQGVADAAAEATRAQGVENALRADLGQKTDDANAEGSAFARIKQLKADLTAETNRATGIEEGLRTDVDTNKAAIETLNGDGEGSVNKKIQTAIAEVNTAAGNLENRVKANEDAIAVINGTGEGSIKDAVAKLVNGAPEAMDTLSELADSITKHQTAYDAYVAQVAKDIAAAEKAAKDYADGKDTTLHTTITGEIATAKTEAINDAAGKISALETKLQANIDKKVDKTTYEAKVAELVQADTTNLAAAKEYADNKDKLITDKIGTASDTLTATTVFGKIKELQEKDAAQDEVIDTKAAAADLDALEALVGEKTNTSADDTVFGKIVAEKERAEAAETALDGRVDALEATVDTATTGLKDRMQTAENDIDALETSMGNAEANITNIQNIINNLVPLEDDELMLMLNTVYNINNNA